MTHLFFDHKTLYKLVFHIACQSPVDILSLTIAAEAHVYSGALSVDFMHLFIDVLDRVVNLYQLTASSCAGCYYHSHMHYFAYFHVYQFLLHICIWTLILLCHIPIIS